MRWLYHLTLRTDPEASRLTPPSLAREGFVHASFRDAVAESARLHFAPGADVVALQIDPRRLDARVEVAETPRGGMPHIHGAVPADAVRATWEVAEIAAAPDRVTGTRTAFVAFEGMTLLDLVGAFDAVARIASMGFDRSATCTIVRATSGQVWADAGAELEVAGAVRPPLDGFDVVVVPGGYGTRALEKDAEVVAWLGAYPWNRIMASVCTGALLLGAAGRLRGRRATTHHAEMGRLEEYGATAVRERVVDEGQVITAGGVTSAIDLGIHLVRRIEGEETARAIAAQMEWAGVGIA